MQDTTTSGTLFGAAAGTGVLLLFLAPEIGIPELIASALIGGGSGAAVGYTVSSADDTLSNSPVATTGGILLLLVALGAGAFVAHKYL
jgi:ABC-type spermidine/putrescine transport system permease subunit I